MSIFERLCYASGDNDWKQVDGPDSRSGVDYWFKNSVGDEAYANDDQGYVTISVNGEQIFASE